MDDVTTAAAQLTAESVVRRALDARVRKFRGSLLVARGDHALRLDEVAEFIFKQLDGVVTIRQVGERLATHYDISPDEATSDSRELLAQFLELGLVTTD